MNVLWMETDSNGATNENGRKGVAVVVAEVVVVVVAVVAVVADVEVVFFSFCCAALVQNASVLENHHWRSAMACLVESGMMDGLDVGERREMQRQIQSLILATDIARQQEFLQALKVRAFLLFLSSLRSSFVFCCRCGYRAVFRVFAATPSAPKNASPFSCTWFDRFHTSVSPLLSCFTYIGWILPSFNELYLVLPSFT